MDYKDQRKIAVENDELVIRIPIDILAYSQQLRSDWGYGILDKERMTKYFIDMFFEYDEQEDGTTAFDVIVDGIFDEAYESGEDWLITDDGDGDM